MFTKWDKKSQATRDAMQKRMFKEVFTKQPDSIPRKKAPLMSPESLFGDTNYPAAKKRAEYNRRQENKHFFGDKKKTSKKKPSKTSVGIDLNKLTPEEERARRNKAPDEYNLKDKKERAAFRKHKNYELRKGRGLTRKEFESLSKKKGKVSTRLVGGISAAVAGYEIARGLYKKAKKQHKTNVKRWKSGDRPKQYRDMRAR